MINVNNSQTNNVFKDFPELKFGQPQITVNSSLLTEKPDTFDIKSGITNSQNIASVNVSDVNDNKKDKKGGIIAATTGTTILAAGIIALVFAKGFSSTTYGKINDLIEHLNKKIYDSSIAEKSKTLLQKGTIGLAKGLKGLLGGLKAVSNFNAVKDSLVRKAFDATSVTKKFADNATNLFKKISFDSIKSGYNKSQLETYEFCDDLIIRSLNSKADKTPEYLAQKIKIKVGDKTAYLPISDILENLEKRSGDAKSIFDDGFGYGALMERQAIRAEELKDVPKNVNNALYNDNGGLLNLKENASRFKTYITEDASLDGKMKLKTLTNNKRKAFTNNVNYNYSLMKSSVKEMSSALDIDDHKSRKILSDISEKIEKYNACQSTTEISERNVIKRELAKDLEKLKLHVGEEYKDKDKVINAIKSQVEFITEDVFESDQKGALQEIMTIIKSLKECELEDGTKLGYKIIDEKNFNMIDKKSKSITSNINKTTRMESEDLLDKYAELEVGSAPSDIVGLALPIGVAAYAISKGDDKNEKISTTLTTGIPIVGSIGAMGYGLIRNVSGAKNIALGLGTGFVLNLIGNSFDKLYKNYQEKRSFTQMALDAYKNNPLFNQQPNSKK